MTLKVKILPYKLRFRHPAGTSRGILFEKTSYLLCLKKGSRLGIGECSVLPGLSPDYDQCRNKLNEVAKNTGKYLDNLDFLQDFPSIRFGLETAKRSLECRHSFDLFDSGFLRGETNLPINALIWMGDHQQMVDQVVTKVSQGWKCLKLKIGAIDFDDEIELLKRIRRDFGPEELEVRVDANGAFSPEHALERIKVLSDFSIHSIEQPIATKQWNDLKELTLRSPIPIALDEELIGVYNTDRGELLDQIKPSYIVCKPSLLGGWKATQEWIDLAIQRNIGWWITSALESNVGLNAIAQWYAHLIEDSSYKLSSEAYQGLGTGTLFTNNIPSPLEMDPNYIRYNILKTWEAHSLFNNV